MTKYKPANPLFTGSGYSQGMQSAVRLSLLPPLFVLTSCTADPCDKSWLWGWDQLDDLRACAEEGHRDAQLRYGKLLALSGRAAESDSWLNRAIAGRGGKGAMAVAQAFSGYDGNQQIAESWYRRAYELGEWEAARELGLLLHSEGKRDEANRWFEQAVDRGGDWAANSIAFSLRHQQEDVAAGAAWYKRAAENGQSRRHEPIRSHAVGRHRRS